jgi:hypothetical protein
VDNSEFFIFLTMNIFWTIIFFGLILGSFLALMEYISEVAVEHTGAAIIAVGMFAVGVAGMCLMIGRVWPSWVYA